MIGIVAWAYIFLDLANDPATPEAARLGRSGGSGKLAAVNISRRPWHELMEPAIIGVCAICLLFGLKRHSDHYWVSLTIDLLALAAFAWEGLRIWGWHLKLLPDGFRIRRYFRWVTIPWESIHDVGVIDLGRAQTRITLKLVSGHSESLGTFFDIFARRLRDRLRYELAQRPH